jgi:signal peptidase II
MIVSSNMNLYESIKIFNNFNITYVQNNGAAFSILSGNVFLLIIISFIILYLIYMYVLKDQKNEFLSILLIGGIISNLVDRIIRGYVIDFIDIKIFNYNFPVFNIADICIVIGTIFLIIKILKEK